jgi:hypothetical protein
VFRPPKEAMSDALPAKRFWPVQPSTEKSSTSCSTDGKRAKRQPPENLTVTISFPRGLCPIR